MQRSMLMTFALCIALAGCTTATSTGITSQSLSCDSTLTYATFGEAFISTNCLSCHATQHPTLSTQADVQANSDEILQEAVYTDAMPENADLSNDERTMLGDWLACGAP